eukprot:SAG31_NODE_19271_length_607_cov_1.356299_1_plen_86_part_10
MCPALEKYGTFIARCNALIEKASPFRCASLCGGNFNYTGGDGNFYSGDTGWHSDGMGADKATTRYIKCAFYLDQLSAASGCLRVLP